MIFRLRVLNLFYFQSDCNNSVFRILSWNLEWRLIFGISLIYILLGKIPWKHRSKFFGTCCSFPYEMMKKSVFKVIVTPQFSRNLKNSNFLHHNFLYSLKYILLTKFESTWNFLSTTTLWYIFQLHVKFQSLKVSQTCAMKETSCKFYHFWTNLKT